MAKRVELEGEVILLGKDFNMSVVEDPETRTLTFSILVKDADELEHQHLSSKLDLRADKKFTTHRVRAIGHAEESTSDEGGVVLVDETDPNQVSSEEFFHERDQFLWTAATFNSNYDIPHVL